MLVFYYFIIMEKSISRDSKGRFIFGKGNLGRLKGVINWNIWEIKEGIRNFFFKEMIEEKLV